MMRSLVTAIDCSVLCTEAVAAQSVMCASYVPMLVVIDTLYKTVARWYMIAGMFAVVLLAMAVAVRIPS